MENKQEEGTRERDARRRGRYKKHYAIYIRIAIATLYTYIRAHLLIMCRLKDISLFIQVYARTYVHTNTTPGATSSVVSSASSVIALGLLIHRTILLGERIRANSI